MVNISQKDQIPFSRSHYQKQPMEGLKAWPGGLLGPASCSPRESTLTRVEKQLESQEQREWEAGE